MFRHTRVENAIKQLPAWITTRNFWVPPDPIRALEYYRLNHILVAKLPIPTMHSNKLTLAEIGVRDLLNYKDDYRERSMSIEESCGNSMIII